MSVNRVFLLGNVGQDPNVREGQSGKFATFTLATTDRGYTKQDGTQIPERTEWHNIVANGRIVDTIERYVSKGMKLYIEGRLRTRKYTGKDNIERYTTEVVLQDMEMLSGGKQQPQQQQPQRTQPAPPQDLFANDGLPF